MNVVTISPSKIDGYIKIPSSKSYAQRAVVAALLKGGESCIENYGSSNDEKIALEIIKKLGATVKIDGDKLFISSQFNINEVFSNKINVGESGLALRLFTCVASLLNYAIEIEGEGSLLDRPISVFENVLPQLNVHIKSTSGKLPILVKGGLQAKSIFVDGAISSQFLSGFLFAFSFLSKSNLLNDDTKISLNKLNSKPYIDITLDVIKTFGLPIPHNENYSNFIFNKTNFQQQNIHYNIEGDWSSAAFILVAAAVAGNVVCMNLNMDSVQADRKIVDVLMDIGLKVNWNHEIISVKKEIVELKSFEFDATDCPDLFPPLVALAANCTGISSIKGVNRLLHKESNRAKTLQNEFAKLGVNIVLDNDEMRITGTKKIIGATINSCNDHRIVMACAIAALNAEGSVKIEGASAVNKSYPNFFKDLKTLGCDIK